MSNKDISAQDVLNFWFEELESKQWWVKDPSLDKQMRQRFGSLHTQAALGELFSWRSDASGRLAEIIVLDQFSRNIYRDTPKAFATDTMALTLAQEAVAQNLHTELDDSMRSFMLMPYMHSESAKIHQQAEKLFREYIGEGALEFELKHKVIIDRFGRYPHRNQILGRESTKEELQFLTEPDSKF